MQAVRSDMSWEVDLSEKTATYNFVGEKQRNVLLCALSDNTGIE